MAWKYFGNFAPNKEAICPPDEQPKTPTLSVSMLNLCAFFFINFKDSNISSIDEGYWASSDNLYSIVKQL